MHSGHTEPLVSLTAGTPALGNAHAVGAGTAWGPVSGPTTFLANVSVSPHWFVLHLLQAMTLLFLMALWFRFVYALYVRCVVCGVCRLCHSVLCVCV